MLDIDSVTVPQGLAGEARKWLNAAKPRKKTSLSEWAIKNLRMEDGTQFKPFPFQIGLMDAFTEDGIRQISAMKSSRVGWSTIVKAYIAYRIANDPRRIIMYQPTVDDAEGYGKDDLVNLLSWPAVRKIVGESPLGTIRDRPFPGGWVKIKGTNSPREFRRITADDVILEEPNGYPEASGGEGDPVGLAFKRCLSIDDSLKVAGSTPTISGFSKITELHDGGTQERRYLPCPHCGEMQVLVFGSGGDGPGIKWAPHQKPTEAWYECKNGCRIEWTSLNWMDERGEWRAHAPENWPHRSFHFWTAYSQFEGASWLEIAKEFMTVRKNPNKLRVFVNQTLAEDFALKGEAPKWRRLYDRREEWRQGSIPRGVLQLYMAFDFQGDRVEGFVWGFGRDRQSWLIDRQVFMGSPFDAKTWPPVEAWARGSYQTEDGVELKPVRIAADVGFATSEVSRFCRKFSPALMMPVKGATTHDAPPISTPKAIDVRNDGKLTKRGIRISMVGDHQLKLELYGLLGLDRPTDAEAAAGAKYPPGYVHLPTWVDEEFCRQMTAETFIPERREWKKTHANEALDGWKYCRAVAIAAGVERYKKSQWDRLEQNLYGDILDGVVVEIAAPRAAAPMNSSPVEKPAAPPAPVARPVSRPAARARTVTFGGFRR